MTNKDINWVYIRQRLKLVVPDCFITDELLKEIYKMLIEIQESNKQGKVKVLGIERSNKINDK